MPGALSRDILKNAMEFLRTKGLTEEQKVSFLDLLNLDPDTATRDLLNRVAAGTIDPDEAMEQIVGQEAEAAGAGGGKRNRDRGEDEDDSTENMTVDASSSAIRAQSAAGSAGSSVRASRPTKAARWDLNSVRVGEELSFIADTPMLSEGGEDVPGSLDDAAFLRHQPPRLQAGGGGGAYLRPSGSVSSISSEYTDALSDITSMSSYYKISHETLRNKLRSGERLEEELFDKIEEVGSSAPGRNDVKTSLFAVGGSGSVYKMRLKSDHQVVCAMKTVPLHLQEGELAKFEQDVRLAYGHQHPNIMPLYDVCIKRTEVNNSDLWQLCIYMHFADHGCLASLMKGHDGHLSVPVVLGVAVQMLEALTFLHNTAHVCHRDLKPSNILLRSDGRVMLQDFGNSRQLGGTFHSMRTYVGCQVYMSPERINGVQYTTKSDVWALALILMESLIGRFPYECDGTGEDSMYGLLERIVEDQVPLHLLQQAGVHDMFAGFLARLLLKDQAQRPASEELLCSRQEAKRAQMGEFEMCYRAADGIGVVCSPGNDVASIVHTSRLWSLPGAAQRAVQTGLGTSIPLSIPPSPAMF